MFSQDPQFEFNLSDLKDIESEIAESKEYYLEDVNIDTGLTTQVRFYINKLKK